MARSIVSILARTTPPSAAWLCKRMERFWSADLSLLWAAAAAVYTRATLSDDFMPMARWTITSIPVRIAVCALSRYNPTGRYYSAEISPPSGAVVSGPLPAAGSDDLIRMGRLRPASIPVRTAPCRLWPCKRMGRLWRVDLSPVLAMAAPPRATALDVLTRTARLTLALLPVRTALSLLWNCKPMARFWSVDHSALSTAQAPATFRAIGSDDSMRTAPSTLASILVRTALSMSWQCKPMAGF